MTRFLLTGFPGFLAARLLPRILAPPDTGGGDPRGRTAVCIVEPRMAGPARELVARLEAGHPDTSGRIELVEGDLTRPGVLAPGTSLGPVDRAWHLAAVYALDVDRETAMAVNVAGTRRLLDLLRDRPELRAFHHVSTCYVSGRHRGTFRETDLDVGQTFANHYEETKFLAEVEVRGAGEAGLPVVVHRPAIVTGDSRSGTAEKHDGLYYLVRWIAAQGRLAAFPRVPGQKRSRFNVVPVDFVVDALARIPERGDVVGRTFHLADPDPLPVSELARLVARELGRRLFMVPLPAPAARRATSLAARLPPFAGIPPEAIDYLSHPTRYATAATAPVLAEEGLRVPAVAEYLPRIVARFLDGGGPRVARGGEETEAGSGNRR